MSSDFLNKLAIFQKRASYAAPNPNQKQTNYINRPIDKSKILNIFQKAQEDQKKNNQKILKKTKTEALFPSQYKGNNVEKFIGNLKNKKKEEEKKNEQIQKEIHEIKKVDNKAIKERIRQANEDKFKNDENKKNEIMKKNEK